MAYKNIVFVKLEKRLLNDYRWYTLSESAQLIFIKLILLAAETYNKIPQNDIVLKEALRCRLELNDFQNCLREIEKSFPKFKKNKHFRYFEDFEQKTNYLKSKQSLSNRSAIAQTAVDKDKEIDKEIEIDKDFTSMQESNNKSNSNSNSSKKFIKPTLLEIAEYAKSINFSINPEKFFDYYESRGWLIGKSKMKDWKAAIRTWKHKQSEGEATAAQNQAELSKIVAGLGKSL